MNELDKLRQKLTEADIPFESYIEKVDLYGKDDLLASIFSDPLYGFTRNQIIYGRLFDVDDYIELNKLKSDLGGIFNEWAFDGICQRGSYGYEDGMIESYGAIGMEDGEPMVLTAEKAFRIIKSDWDALDEQTKKTYATRAVDFMSEHFAFKNARERGTTQQNNS